MINRHTPNNVDTARPTRSDRRAFTLVEVALATVIGSIVLIAAMGLLMTLERSERSVSKRANESAQLQRARFVLQRAIGSILVSAPAPQQRAVPNAVAVPADSSGNPTGSGASSKEPAAARDRGASTRGRTDDGAKTGSADDKASSGSISGAAGAGASGRNNASSDDSKAGAGANANQPMIRAPEDAPPRVILHHDELVSQYVMTIKEQDGTLSVQSPQRLELVLIEPPVPTQQADPFVLAHAVKLEAKRRGISRTSADEDAPDTASVSGDAASDPDAAASEEWGIRAVRGAFELIPKPETARDATGVERPTGRAVLDEQGNPKSWELWWVPLAPRHTIQEVRDMGRARAVLEASSYGEPFRIATDIASMRYRMFDDRLRKDTFEATIQNQLPAYVEVDISTVSGLSASWLFEVSWATGPETRPPVDNTNGQQSPSGGSTLLSGSAQGDSKNTRPSSSSRAQPGTTPTSRQPASTQPSQPQSPNPTQTVPPRRSPYRVEPAVPVRDKGRGR